MRVGDSNQCSRCNRPFAHVLKIQPNGDYHNVQMTRLDSILKEIDLLSDKDKTALVEKLLHLSLPEPDADEIATGQRGLNAWTESTRNESWAEFYPDDLRGNGDPSR